MLLGSSPGLDGPFSRFSFMRPQFHRSQCYCDLRQLILVYFELHFSLDLTPRFLHAKDRSGSHLL